MKTMSHDEYVASVRRYVFQISVQCFQSICIFLNGAVLNILLKYYNAGRVLASPEVLHNLEELPGSFNGNQ